MLLPLQRPSSAFERVVDPSLFLRYWRGAFLVLYSTDLSHFHGTASVHATPGLAAVWCDQVQVL